MTRTRAKFLLVPLLLLVMVLVAVWLVLAAPMFSQMRRELLEEVLSAEIGQPITIEDDVRIVLGPITRIHASGVRLPSETMPDIDLAELALLEIDLDLFALAGGTIDLNNLVIYGLLVRLISDANGINSWSEATERETVTTETSEETGDGNLVLFLENRNFKITDVGLEIVNGKTGFEFLVDLTDLKLDREHDEGVPTLTGNGTLNGKAITIDGTFPADTPFSLNADIAGVAIAYDGESRRTETGPNHEAQLTIQIESLGDLLDILKLKRNAEGAGRLSTTVAFDGTTLALSDIDTVVDIGDGTHIEVTGTIDDVLTARGIELAADSRLFPVGQPPPPATSLEDLVLTGIASKFIGDASGFRVDDLRVSTNAFESELKSIGPMSVRQLIRTPEGQLEMNGIKLTVGAKDAPYLVATGDVSDLLGLSGLHLTGQANLPADLVLPASVPDPHVFGRLVAEFAADDSAGHLALRKLAARAEETDLWSAKVNMHVSDIVALADVDVAIDLDFPSVDRALEALGAATPASGPLNLHASLQGHITDFEAALGLSAAKSDLNVEWRTTLDGRTPRLTGRIFSDLIDMDEIAVAIDAVGDLGVLLGAGTDTPDAERPQDKKMQPLVLPEEREDSSGRTELQPLVVDAAEASEQSAAQQGNLQPLVLPEEDTEDSDLAGLLDFPTMLRTADADVTIDIAKISGQQGISKVESKLVVAEGKAGLGPIDLAYGGGNASVSAGVNLIDSPDWISLSGSTGGWDFGKILDAVNAGIPAYGILNGRFDVTGRYQSPTAFLNSMSGWAHISLRNGKIGTSLLELAGLGVLPWLFSRELSDGYTRIVCIEAPLALESGRISSSSIVLETEAVQVVTKGFVDLRRETIGLRAEPRPVGKAGARSAFPVDVTGSLGNPDISVKPGGPGIRLPTLDGGKTTARVPCKPDAKQGR
jgi:uncharacterized protein involved in outer membrane biogenesis